MITYILIFLFFTWILPGSITFHLILKYTREARNSEIKYNTLADFIWATMGFFCGLLGLIAMITIKNENRIIKTYKNGR